MTNGPAVLPHEGEAYDQRHPGGAIGVGVRWSATWGLRVVMIAGGLAVFGYLIGQLWVIVLPVVLALIGATVLQPPAAWLIRHRFRPALAALISVAVAGALLVGLVVVLAPSVLGQLGNLAGAAIAGIGQVQALLAGPPLNLGAGQVGAVLDTITQQLQQSASTITSTVLTGLGNVASGLLTFGLAVVLAFLFVKDGPRFLPWLHRTARSRAGPHLDVVLRRSWRTLGGFIRTQALVGLVDAVFIGAALLVLGVPLAVPLAVLTFFATFIPYVGAIVTGALAVLIALVSQGPTTALITLVVVLAVQQLEGNVLLPMLQGRSLGLHPAVVLLAVAAGGSLFGVAGAFLAVPVAAVASTAVRYLNEQITDHTGERSRLLLPLR